METQTRAHDGELKRYDSLVDAMKFAKANPQVWKVSFNAYDGTRVRLVRTTIGWIYEDIMTEERYV
jgi:hypothetical protein